MKTVTLWLSMLMEVCPATLAGQPRHFGGTIYIVYKYNKSIVHFVHNMRVCTRMYAYTREVKISTFLKKQKKEAPQDEYTAPAHARTRGGHPTKAICLENEFKAV